jgi:hypothetical protein
MNYTTWWECRDAILHEMMKTKKSRADAVYELFRNSGCKCLCGATTYGYCIPCEPINRIVDEQIKVEAYEEAQRIWKDIINRRRYAQ